jgi:hypothetical protein
MSTTADVYIFEDLDLARAFQNLVLKEGKFVKELWEFKSLPIIMTEPSRHPQKHESAPIVRRDYPISYARIIKGLDFLISEKVDAINLSLGPEELTQNDPLEFAVEQCLQSGIFVIVAAGNYGPGNNTMQPLARIPGVISVGAVGDDKVLLPKSSRGPEGGFGPTVVSYGRPDVISIKEGWDSPMLATSYAAPRVTRIVVVILKAMQLLWANYEKISNSSWDNQTTPLPLSILGFADTGIDPKAITPLPDRVAEHLRSKGEFVRFSTDDRQRQWFEKVYERFHSCSMMDISLYSVMHAIEIMAKPLPAFRPHEVGAGLVSLKECHEFLTKLTPTRFIQIFSPGDQGNEFAKKNVDLDEVIGPLWDLNYVNMIIEFFYDGARLAVAKVV